MNPYTVVIHVAYPAFTVVIPGPYTVVIHGMYTVVIHVAYRCKPLSLLHIDILYEFIVGEQDMPSYCDLL
jgi:hypothetical protein